MLVGLTYDLREEYRRLGYSEDDVAEFDSPRTVEAIEDALLTLGFRTERVGNIFSLVQSLSGGKTWDIVFNITEGLKGYGREAQVPALLEAYGIPYTFSDPLTMSLTLHKGMTKHVLRDNGIPTPEFAVIESLLQAESMDLAYPLFAKPVAEGTGKGITAASRVENRERLLVVCRELLERYRQPVLVETYLAGREFTVGILGTGTSAASLGVMEVTLLAEAESGVYSYLNKELWESRVQYLPARDDSARRAAEIALEAWRVLGGRDAGRADLRCDEFGHPYFLEVNPLAGLHPEHSDLPILCGLHGIGFVELVEGIMQSALARTSHKMPVPRPVIPRIEKSPKVSGV